MKTSMRRLLIGASCGMAIVCFAGEFGVEASSSASMASGLAAPTSIAPATDKNGSHQMQSAPLLSHNASWTALFHAAGR